MYDVTHGEKLVRILSVDALMHFLDRTVDEDRLSCATNIGEMGTMKQPDQSTASGESLLEVVGPKMFDA